MIWNLIGILNIIFGTLNIVLAIVNDNNLSAFGVMIGFISLTIGIWILVAQQAHNNCACGGEK